MLWTDSVTDALLSASGKVSVGEIQNMCSTIVAALDDKKSNNVIFCPVPSSQMAQNKNFVPAR